MPNEITTVSVNGGEGRLRSLPLLQNIVTAAGVTTNQAHQVFDTNRIRGRVANIAVAISQVMTTTPSLTFRVRQSDDNVNFFDTVGVNGSAFPVQLAAGSANENFLVVGDYLQVLVTVAGTGSSHSYTVTLGPAL